LVIYELVSLRDSWRRLRLAFYWPTQRGSKGGNVVGSMARRAVAAVLLGVLVSFVFFALFFLVKVICVLFGVLILLAMFGAGDSD
jgi:hypothetical protein